jgi:hypothetical protein
MLNKIFRNKRGDKVLSIYWFAILILVSGGVFAMVYVFYGSPYDIRDIEANLMINQIADCVSYAGRMNTNLISNGEFKTSDFLDECHFILNSTEFDEEQYYTEIKFYKPENMNAPVFSLKRGNNKWLTSCNLQEDKEQERLAQCVEKSFYSIDNINNQYIIKILSVVSKTGKNVKI